MAKYARKCRECGAEYTVTLRTAKHVCRRCQVRINSRRYRKQHQAERRVAERARHAQRRARKQARAQVLGLDIPEPGSTRGANARSAESRNTTAELIALQCVEILQVAPELVTDEMWERLCVLHGGEPLGVGSKEDRV